MTGANKPLGTKFRAQFSGRAPQRFKTVSNASQTTECLYHGTRVFEYGAKAAGVSSFVLLKMHCSPNINLTLGVGVQELD